MFILYTGTGNMVHMLEKLVSSVRLKLVLEGILKPLGKPSVSNLCKSSLIAAQSSGFEEGTIGWFLEKYFFTPVKVRPEYRKCVPGTTRNPAHFPALHPDAMVL
jgi:hypothetical protein